MTSQFVSTSEERLSSVIYNFKGKHPHENIGKEISSLLNNELYHKPVEHSVWSLKKCTTQVNSPPFGTSAIYTYASNSPKTIPAMYILEIKHEASASQIGEEALAYSLIKNVKVTMASNTIDNYTGKNLLLYLTDKCKLQEDRDAIFDMAGGSNPTLTAANKVYAIIQAPSMFPVYNISGKQIQFEIEYQTAASVFSTVDSGVTGITATLYAVEVRTDKIIQPSNTFNFHYERIIGRETEEITGVTTSGNKIISLDSQKRNGDCIKVLVGSVKDADWATKNYFTFQDFTDIKFQNNGNDWYISDSSDISDAVALLWEKHPRKLEGKTAGTYGNYVRIDWTLQKMIEKNFGHKVTSKGVFFTPSDTIGMVVNQSDDDYYYNIVFVYNAIISVKDGIPKYEFSG